jgi:hypothetical protein
MRWNIQSHFWRWAVIPGLLAGLIAGAAWGADMAAPEPATGATPLETAGLWLFHHFEIGTRLTLFRLLETRRNWPDHFYGTITELKEEQNYWPIKFFVDLTFNRYLGVEATWDEVRAEILASDTSGLSDGTLDLRGPIFSVFGRYPVARFVPYAGVGVMLVYSSFDPTDMWHYRDLPPEAQEEQNFAFDNAVAPVVYGGLGVQFSRHWSADLYLRYTYLELKGEHYFKLHGDTLDETRQVEIPMSNLAGGISIRYAF